VGWHALPATVGTEAGSLARIEIEREEMARAFDVKDEITSAGKRAGFTYVTLDLGGYRRGSHNEVLSGRSLRIVS
jgi:uncharacterized protein